VARTAPTAVDARLDEAIQSGCGSLLALEASLHCVEDVPGEHGRAEAAIRAAMEMVRASIAELQALVPPRPTSQLGLGFVTRRGQAAETDQDTPLEVAMPAAAGEPQPS
jgi:hypothetical protein